MMKASSVSSTNVWLSMIALADVLLWYGKDLNSGVYGVVRPELTTYKYQL